MIFEDSKISIDLVFHHAAAAAAAAAAAVAAAAAAIYLRQIGRRTWGSPGPGPWGTLGNLAGTRGPRFWTFSNGMALASHQFSTPGWLPKKKMSPTPIVR